MFIFSLFSIIGSIAIRWLFIYDEEIRNLRQEIKKLREENLNLKNRLEDSMNNEFELAFKLEAINNYITVLETKLRG